MTDKKYEKIVKILGPELVAELNSLDKEALSAVIVTAAQAMEQVQKELDDNAAYQALKESKSDMEAGLKGVNKFQKAKVAIAIDRLRELGQ